MAKLSDIAPQHDLLRFDEKIVQSSRVPRRYDCLEADIDRLEIDEDAIEGVMENGGFWQKILERGIRGKPVDHPLNLLYLNSPSILLAKESYEATVGASSQPIQMTIERTSAVVNNASPRALIVTPLLALLTLLRHALQKRTEESSLNKCSSIVLTQLKASTHFGVFAVVLDCVSVYLAPAAVILSDLLIHRNESLSLPISLPFPLCPAMVYNFAAIVAVGTSFLIRKGLLFEVRFVHNEQVPPAIPFFLPNRA
ncbi:unnamed protein product [Caenorhabditis nigoni]